MKINFYNKNNSKIDEAPEVLSFHPSVLIADVVHFDCLWAGDIYCYLEIDKHSDEMVFRLTSIHYKNDEATNDLSKNLEKYANDLKALLKIKHKTKEQLVLLGQYRGMAKKTRDFLKEIYEHHLLKRNLLVLAPFANEKVIEIGKDHFFEERKKENLYIKELKDAITKHETLLCLDEGIEKLFGFCLFTEIELGFNDFIKVPMWDFPQFVGITYEQMKHTKDNLQSVLEPFKIQLENLADQLMKISYSPDNLKQIKQLLNENLMHHKTAVQHSINESLYLIQQRNRFDNNNNLKFCFGICSTETLVNYYEKNEVLFPYVATELKQQLSRHIDLNGTCIFSYYELNYPNKITN